jgi:hypothetical protein
MHQQHKFNDGVSACLSEFQLLVAGQEMYLERNLCMLFFHTEECIRLKNKIPFLFPPFTWSVIGVSRARLYDGDWTTLVHKTAR